jgi:HAL2 family 3'(2'),5'-bisphosphate nucleotidase
MTDYSQEVEIACLAVQRAALLTKRIIAAVDKGALDKKDNTPVTVADFAAQALIISAVRHAFPSDTFVGEESAATLREDPPLLDRVWGLVSSTQLDDDDEDPSGEARLATPATKDEMLEVIDLGGTGQGGSTGRIWVLDPIDGTATFMKGQQYAVCLALIEDGQQRLGILGCPNLLLESPTTAQVHEDVVDRDGHGQTIFAVAGQGAFIRPLGRSARLAPAQALPSRMRPEDINLSDLRFVDCEAAGSTDYEKHRRVAAKLGVAWPPRTDLWSSQMRYIALAVGGCHVLLKIMRKKTYHSSIWDHAGGMLIAQEIGCTITDVEGNPVDCGLGRTLAGAMGLVVAPTHLHQKVLSTVQEVIKESS